MILGVNQEVVTRLREVVTDYDLHGPNRRYEGGETVAERLLVSAKQVVTSAKSDGDSFADSLKLDMVEKWIKDGKMGMAVKLGECMRAGKPIREAIEEVIRIYGRGRG